MSQRVLVTGAAGFMGSHLVDALIAKGHEVYGVDDLSGGYTRNLDPRCRFTKLDLREKEATDRYISEVRPQILFHLAADATEGRSQFTPVQCTERNYMAYLYTLIPAIRTGQLEKVVLTSSMSVYGAQETPFSEDMEPRPEDVYAVAKTSMEKSTEILADVHKFRYTIIRPHNVYGAKQNLADPYRNVVGIFINRMLQNKHFYIYGDGEQTRAFTYIEDFTPYILRAGWDEKTDSEIINVGPREEYTINVLARTVLSNFVEDPDNPPAHLKPQYLPSRPREVKEAYCTTEKAERLLGYTTTVTLAEGVAKMVAWARELGPQEPHYLEDGLELITDHVPATWKEKLI